jgi:glutamate synthase (NADPH/NADH) large chain
MTGGVVYLLDASERTLNRQYVQASPLCASDVETVQALLREHLLETGSPAAEVLLGSFDPARFARVTTCIAPEALE